MQTAAATPELVDETTQLVTTIQETATSEAGELLARAHALEIDCVEAADVVAEYRNDIVDRRKAIVTRLAGMKSHAHKAWKDICDLEREATGKFDEPERVLNGKLKAWNDAQARLRREAEAAAERERQRLMDEERQRRALEAEAAGQTELANRIVEGRTPTPVPHVPVAVPPPQKVAGVAFVARYGFRITDPSALPREYLIPDEKAIGGVVRSLGLRTAIPGVEVFEDSTVRKAGRR